MFPYKNANPPLLITFVHQGHQGRYSIRCCGCQALHPSAGHDEKNQHGTITLQGKTVHVRDEHDRPCPMWPISTETCILVYTDPDSNESVGVLFNGQRIHNEKNPGEPGSPGLSFLANQRGALGL
jgi:hypothetical protein